VDAGKGPATLSRRSIPTPLFSSSLTISKTRYLCTLITLRLSSLILDMPRGTRARWTNSDSSSRMRHGWLRLGFVRRFISFYLMLYVCGSDVCSIMSTLAANVALFPAQAQNRPEPLLIVPFQRDSMFVGREDIIAEVEKRHKQEASRNHTRVALVGLGGVG